MFLGYLNVWIRTLTGINSLRNRIILKLKDSPVQFTTDRSLIAGCEVGSILEVIYNDSEKDLMKVKVISSEYTDLQGNNCIDVVEVT